MDPMMSCDDENEEDVEETMCKWKKNTDDSEGDMFSGGPLEQIVENRIVLGHQQVHLIDQ